MKTSAAKLKAANYTCLKWCLKCCTPRLQLAQIIILQQDFFGVNLAYRQCPFSVEMEFCRSTGSICLRLTVAARPYVMVVQSVSNTLVCNVTGI